MYDWPSAASATESAYLFDALVAEVRGQPAALPSTLAV